MKTVELIVNLLMLVAAVILVIVVLLQNATSSGIGSVFGNDTTALGQARSQKVSKEVKLQKLTITFAVIIGVLALLLVVMPGIEAMLAAKK